MTPDVDLDEHERGTVVGRCSCWIRGDTGIIGNYSAADEKSGAALLSRAFETLANAGCTSAVGPMDGSTWQRYRLVTDRGAEPPFFLEPDNPDEWPQHWSLAGFSPCATYTSAVNENLATEDPRTEATLERLAAVGITLQPFDRSDAAAELTRLYELAQHAFAANPFYTAIGEERFCAQMEALLPFVRSELVLLAVRDGHVVGFIFALPDTLQAQRGLNIDTVILKTVAVAAQCRGMGLGGVLIDLVQRAARRMGFRRTIHALMHEGSVSRKISDRYARTFRRYALFSRPVS